jgi:hypothetical protein
LGGIGGGGGGLDIGASGGRSLKRLPDSLDAGFPAAVAEKGW